MGCTPVATHPIRATNDPSIRMISEIWPGRIRIMGKSSFDSTFFRIFFGTTQEVFHFAQRVRSFLPNRLHCASQAADLRLDLLDPSSAGISHGGHNQSNDRQEQCKIFHENPPSKLIDG